MAHARSRHPYAPLTPQGRRRMVACVLDRGWSIEATADRFQVDAKTVRKWRDRFVAEGPEGLLDRSSRPRHRIYTEAPRRSHNDRNVGRSSSLLAPGRSVPT